MQNNINKSECHKCPSHNSRLKDNTIEYDLSLRVCYSMEIKCCKS